MGWSFQRILGTRVNGFRRPPAKPIPVKRPAPMSDPSWFGSIAVSGPSGLPRSLPSHRRQSTALGSASRGRQIDGRGGGYFNFIDVGLPWSVPNHEQFAASSLADRRQPQQIDGRGVGEFNSVDTDGVSGFPWSVPNHGQSAALASAGRGQQTAGRGGGESGALGTLVFNSEGNAAVNSSDEVAAQQAGEENHGIDLNKKTPPPKLPKLRRRKYMPMVIRGGSTCRSSSGVTFDLNGSTNLVVNEDARILQNPNQPPQPSWLDLLKARQADYESRAKNMNQSQQPVRREDARILQSPNQPPQPSRLDLLKGKWQADFESRIKNMNQSQQPVRRVDARIPQTPNQPPQPSRLDLSKAKWQADYESRVKNMNQSVVKNMNRSQQPVRREDARILQTPNQPPQPSRLDLLKAKWQTDFESRVENMNQSMVKNMNQSQQPVRREDARILQTPQPSRLDLLKAKWQGEYESMVKNMNQSQQQPLRREGENLKKLARMVNCQSIPGNHGRHVQDGRNLAASNRISDVHGEKRNYNLVDNDRVAVNTSIVQPDDGSGRVSGNYNASSTNPCFPDFHKRRRVQNGQQELTHNASLWLDCTPGGWKIIHATQNTSEVFSFADAQWSVALGRRQSSKRMLAFDQVERETNDRLV